MKLEMFSVFDSKARAYAQPFFLPTVGLAQRAFGEAAARPDNQINKHPGDFTLFHLGTFDDATAEYDRHPQPINLGSALNFLGAAENV